MSVYATEFRPLHDFVLVREETTEEERQIGGVYLPGDMAKDHKRGEFLDVGPGRRTDNGVGVMPVSVEVGNTIAYYGGTTITIDGEQLVLIQDGNILGVIESADPS